MAPLSPSSPLDVRDAKPRLRVEIEGFQERRRAAWLVFGAIDAGVRETEGELALPWTLRGCRSLLLAVNYTRPTITAGTSAIGVK